MRPEAVIFDLDGVIVSTDEFHYEAWKALAEKEGIPFDRKKNNRLRGISRRESLLIILEEKAESYGEEEISAMLEWKNNKYKELLISLGPSDILPGVAETLETLNRCGIKTAIGSSSKNAPFILKQIGLEKSFDVIIDGNQIKFSKPDPEVFLKGSDAMGIMADKVLVVEDALAGVEAAKNAGMKVLALGDASRSDQADYRAYDLTDGIVVRIMKGS